MWESINPVLALSLLGFLCASGFFRDRIHSPFRAKIEIWTAISLMVIAIIIALFQQGMLKRYHPEKVELSADGCMERILYEGRYSYRRVC